MRNRRHSRSGVRLHIRAAQKSAVLALALKLFLFQNAGLVSDGTIRNSVARECGAEINVLRGALRKKNGVDAMALLDFPYRQIDRPCIICCSLSHSIRPNDCAISFKSVAPQAACLHVRA